MPTTILTTTEAGEQITRDDLHWGGTLGAATGPVSFGFRTSAPSYSVSGENVQGTFSAFSATEQAAARDALATWASLANITFTDLGNSNSASIEFANYASSTDNSEAFTFYPGNTSAGSSDGDVFVNTYYASTANDAQGTYEYMTFLHEIGHALGLEHPADYNAGPNGIPTYQNSATYIEDTRQYSLMSYFSEGYTGGHYSVYDETPMLDDIAAIQRLYGANPSTRTGSDTYGFHSTLSGTAFSIASASQHVVFTVYDCGGNDTFDFSSYAQAQTIDLNAEHFSSVGGDTYNVCIAQNTTIENAIGGSGNDTIIGNPAANVLNGSAGDDHIYGNGGGDTLNGGDGNDYLVGGPGADTFNGGAGIDTVSYETAPAAVTARPDSSLAQDGYGGTDTLTSIENLVGSKFNDILIGNSDNNVLNGNGGSDYLIGWSGNDTLVAAAGVPSTLQGGLGNDFYIVHAAGTSIVEFAGEGVDSVQTDLATFTLPQNVENLSYSGSGSFTGLGNDLNNVITAGSGSSYLIGAGGNDTLITGPTASTLQGGTGNDIYAVQTAQSTIVEFGNEGVDQVQTFLSAYTLPANVENLTFVGRVPHAGTGNALDNVFTGGPCDDVFTGAGGNDVYNHRVAGGGMDTIVDFDPNSAHAAEHDLIDLSGRGLTLSQLAFTPVADGTTIGIPGGDAVHLMGVAVAALHSDSFLL